MSDLKTVRKLFKSNPMGIGIGVSLQVVGFILVFYGQEKYSVLGALLMALGAALLSWCASCPHSKEDAKEILKHELQMIENHVESIMEISDKLNDHLKNAYGVGTPGSTMVEIINVQIRTAGENIGSLSRKSTLSKHGQALQKHSESESVRLLKALELNVSKIKQKVTDLNQVAQPEAPKHIKESISCPVCGNSNSCYLEWPEDNSTEFHCDKCYSKIEVSRINNKVQVKLINRNETPSL